MYTPFHYDNGMEKINYIAVVFLFYLPLPALISIYGHILQFNSVSIIITKDTVRIYINIINLSIILYNSGRLLMVFKLKAYVIYLLKMP